MASTTPTVPGAHAGLGLRLRATVPPIGGPYGLSLSATGLFNDGSEFYRVSGADTDPNPADFVASRVKRAGGVLGVSKDFRSRLHAGLDFREEALTAELPSPAADPARALEHIAYTVTFSISGHPAISVPWTTAADGRPIGIQLVGRRFADVPVLALGAACERMRPELPPWPAAPA